MDEKVKVVEEPIVIQTVAKSMDTEIKEEIQEVSVQTVSTANIEVEDENIIDIEMSEAFPFMTNGALNEAMDDKDVLLDGGLAIDKNAEFVALQDLLEISADSGTVSHSLLHGRNLSNQHEISAITGLRKELNDLGVADRVYSNESGLGEFRRWSDGNPGGEDRSGYFVTISDNGYDIEICGEAHDVYGISVSSSGFVGNQNSEYQKGKDIVNNYANSTAYSIVGIVGAMRVHTDGTARKGDYVVPASDGMATLSKNSYGYKVLSTSSILGYEYVTIAITPQSDALSRLQESVAGGDLRDLFIKIEDVEIKVNASDKDIQDIIGELEDMTVKVTTADEVAKTAIKNADEAISIATNAATEARDVAQEAKDAADGAIHDVRTAVADTVNLKNDLQPIIDWGADDDYGAANGVHGFITQANSDHKKLVSLMTGDFPDGTSLAAIIQKVDANGAMIQHLTSHVDKYSVGEYSVTHGLTYNEAKSILSQEHIYVPTKEYKEVMDVVDDETGEINEETMSFEFETSDTHYYRYKWIPYNEDKQDSGKWDKEKRIVITSAEYVNEDDIIDEYDNKLEIGDLWYCIRDVDDVPVGVSPLKGGNLYIWTGYMWDWVASNDDNYQSRIIASMKQTDNSIRADIVALDERATSIAADVNGITTSVTDANRNISAIQQNVETITATVQTTENAVASVQQQADETDASLTAITYGRFHVVYHSYLGTAPDVVEDGKKYNNKPVWNDETGIFEFADSDEDEDENGAYYFTSDDETKYCEVVYDVDGVEVGYNIWTIGNKATSMIDSRISEAEASISELVEFKTETTDSLANTTALANENKASITNLTSRNYHKLLRVSEEEVAIYGEYRFANPPEWKSTTRKYEFDIDDRIDDGIYYMADENDQTYCRIVTASDGTVLYEIYGVVIGSIAAVEQKVEDNSSSIGLVVQRVEKVIDENGNLTDDSISSKGSIIIEAINGESTATIEADRVNIAASTVISSIVDNGVVTPAKIIQSINGDTSTTTISADKINLAASSMFSAVVGKEDDIITPASIVAAINGSESSVKIDADHVEIDADSIDLSAHKMFKAVVGEDGAITPASIVAAIDNTDGTSKLSLSADHIDFKSSTMFSAIVDDDGNITPASIVAKINDDTSNVTINADKIDLNGYVTIDNLQDGKTVISGSNITTGTINANRISLYGITVKQKITQNGQTADGGTTFSIDESGNVTINGTVHMGAGSTISWDNVIGSGDNDPVMLAQNANTTANAANQLAGNANITANIASGSASSAVDMAQSIARGEYKENESGKNTFISERKIFSPQIYANEFNAISTASDGGGSFNLYGTFGETMHHMLRILYSRGDSPNVSFGSPAGAYGYWTFPVSYFQGYKYFTGTVDFSMATVIGLSAVAVFG